MNPYHLNCRNARSFGFMLAVVVCIYVVLNVIYIVANDSIPNDTLLVSDTAAEKIVVQQELQDPNTISGRLKFYKPDINGKVEVVLYMDAKELAHLLGNSQLEGLHNAKESQSSGTPGTLPINISYVLSNPDVCEGVDPYNFLYIAAINSPPENGLQRALLRETWANSELLKRSISRTIFLLGRSVDSAVETSVRAEFDKYHDIVQGDFLDVTRNATLKGIMALRFISEHCSKAKYYIKTNDDTFLNIFEIMNLMVTTSKTSPTQSVICPLWKDNTMPILRDPKDCMQWCVADNELPGRTHFPQYCAGLAFILSQDLVAPLYRSSQTTPFFWIDDVYITGILLPRAVANPSSIHVVDLISNFSLNENEMAAEYANVNYHLRHPIAKIHNTEIFSSVWQSLLQRLPPSQFKLLSDVVMAKIDAPK